jgi:hypothetical protein
MGAASNTPLINTTQEHRHQLVHRDAANAATNDVTQDANLKIVKKTESSKNKNQHAIQCEYFHSVVNSGQIAG